MFYRSTPPAGRRNRRAVSNRIRRVRGRAAWSRPAAPSGRNDKGLETLELWKKRALVAFLLISLCLGAAALLVLEAGVVYKVFVIEFGMCAECRSMPPTAARRVTESDACPLPLPSERSHAKDAPGVTPGAKACPNACEPARILAPAQTPGPRSTRMRLCALNSCRLLLKACPFRFAFAGSLINLDAIMGRRVTRQRRCPLLPRCARPVLAVSPQEAIARFGARGNRFSGDGITSFRLPSERPRHEKPRRGKEEQTMQNNERQDIYTRITGKIVAALEQGVRPWIRPWNAENAAAGSRGPCATTACPIPASTS